PSFVTVGPPQDLSNTALRPLGPRVALTARASFSTPASRDWRAWVSKRSSLAGMGSDSPNGGILGCWAGAAAPTPAGMLGKDGASGVRGGPGTAGSEAAFRGAGGPCQAWQGPGRGHPWLPKWQRLRRPR